MEDTTGEEIAALLLRQERAIAAYYEACAGRFPRQRAFWEDLVTEEQSHAEAIEEILGTVDGKLIALDDERFRKRPLEISLDYISEVTAKVNRPGFTLLQALAIAESLENTVTEARYFEIFKGESSGLAAILKRLDEESTEHRERIKAALAEVRAGRAFEPRDVG